MNEKLIITSHGHYTLIGSIAVVTLILLSQRSSLEEFAPYIPVLVALVFWSLSTLSLGSKHISTRGMGSPLGNVIWLPVDIIWKDLIELRLTRLQFDPMENSMKT